MLVSLVFDLLVISWMWITIRLKTKKQTLIRIFLSIVFFVFNLLALIFTLQDSVLKEDVSVFVVLVIYNLIFLLLWGLRLVSDLLFLSRKTFENKEIILSEKIVEKFNLKKKTTCNFISEEDNMQINNIKQSKNKLK